MKRKKRIKKDPHLWVGIIILIFLFIVGFALTQEAKKYYLASTTVDEQTSPQQMLPDLAEALDIKPETRESIYWNWIDEDNKLVPLKGSEFSMGSVNINGIGQYKQSKNGDINEFNLAFFQPIFSTADRVFQDNGFTKNAFNSNSKPDEYGAVYGGYEKGELKCLYNFMVQSDPFGRFFCGYIDKDQLALQEPFKHLFSMEYIPGQQPPLLRIEKVFGDAALGNYASGSGPGGYTFMAKKKAGQWQVVWRGQEIALCSEMQRLQIPKEIYGECYQQ